jgi:hypothetical protein
MKLLVCLFLFLIPTLNYGFKKYVLPFSIVISKADLIVDGTISKVSKNEYEFTISQFVKGKSNLKIKVSIWEEWLCDPRIKELKTGQRLILLLEKTPYGNYKPINESTGELYVDKDTFTNFYIAQDYSNPNVLKKGVFMFLKTYTLYGNINDRFLQTIYFQSNKSIFEIYRMKDENKFFKYLVDSDLYNFTIKYYPSNQLIY